MNRITAYWNKGKVTQRTETFDYIKLDYIRAYHDNIKLVYQGMDGESHSIHCEYIEFHQR